MGGSRDRLGPSPDEFVRVGGPEWAFAHRVTNCHPGVRCCEYQLREIACDAWWHAGCSIYGVPTFHQPSAKLLSALASPRPSSAATDQSIRSRILDAALAEFADKGLEDASLEAVAARIGATAPQLLQHFGSEESLWKDAVEMLCERLAATIDTAAADGRHMTGRDALRALVRRLVYLFAANPAIHRLLRDESAAAGEYAEWRIADHLAPLFAKIEAVYSRAVDEGGVRPMPFDLALFMILGAASQYLEARRLVSKVFGRCQLEGAGKMDYVGQVLDFCFAGLSTEPVWTISSTPMQAAAAL